MAAIDPAAFNARPDQMPETGPIDRHVVGHDFGAAEAAPTEAGGGMGPVDKHVTGHDFGVSAQTAPTE